MKQEAQIALENEMLASPSKKRNSQSLSNLKGTQFRNSPKKENCIFTMNKLGTITYKELKEFGEFNPAILCTFDKDDEEVSRILRKFGGKNKTIGSPTENNKKMQMSDPSKSPAKINNTESTPQNSVAKGKAKQKAKVVALQMPLQNKKNSVAISPTGTKKDHNADSPQRRSNSLDKATLIDQEQNLKAQRVINKSFIL